MAEVVWHLCTGHHVFPTCSRAIYPVLHERLSLKCFLQTDTFCAHTWWFLSCIFEAKKFICWQACRIHLRRTFLRTVFGIQAFFSVLFRLRWFSWSYILHLSAIPCFNLLWLSWLRELDWGRVAPYRLIFLFFSALVALTYMHVGAPLSTQRSMPQCSQDSRLLSIFLDTSLRFESNHSDPPQLILFWLYMPQHYLHIPCFNLAWISSFKDFKAFDWGRGASYRFICSSAPRLRFVTCM